MTFRATVLTLYPEMFPGPLGVSLAGRALGEGMWSLDAVQIRDFATDKHRSVDDTPAGGGAGMVLRADVLAAALDSVADGRPMLALTPRGHAADPGSACANLAAGEGVDPPLRPLRGIRRADLRGPRRSSRSRSATMSSPAESLGRWSLLDACVRLLPGVMGAASSGEEESFEAGASRISALYPTSDMGRAHDPRSAAVGGSCEDRRVATRKERSKTHG